MTSVLLVIYLVDIIAVASTVAIAFVDTVFIISVLIELLTHYSIMEIAPL